MFIRFGPGGVGVWPLVGGILGLVLFALFIASVIWLIVALTRPRRWVGTFPGGGWHGPPRNPALEELDIAYARGQMSREEYFRRRADLTGWTPPGASPPGFSTGSGPAPGEASHPS
ncbi:MAG TPA: hypothetical protein VEK76_08820 [Candidatus Binatia bacterium]|nr:hypothetical protein [Candidatus Binatia bacterium]